MKHTHTHANSHTTQKQNKSMLLFVSKVVSSGKEGGGSDTQGKGGGVSEMLGCVLFPDLSGGLQERIYTIRIHHFYNKKLLKGS